MRYAAFSIRHDSIRGDETHYPQIVISQQYALCRRHCKFCEEIFSSILGKNKDVSTTMRFAAFPLRHDCIEGKNQRTLYSTLLMILS